MLTGGGDAPGLNAVVRAVVKTAASRGAGVIGFQDGFRGLVDDRAAPLSYEAVSGIITEGGTILGTSNRDNCFGVPRGGSQKLPPGRDRTADALRTVRRRGLAGVVCIGGDGTLTVAAVLQARGLNVVGVPKTIDNDVRGTDQTFGFDTAATVAAEALDRLRTTALSHHRVMVLEVMGRHAGWIALHAGLAGGGDVVLIPEIPFDWGAVAAVVRRRSRRGRRFSLVVAAEGARPRGGSEVYERRGGRRGRERLGGIGPLVARTLEARTGVESRAVVLGHLQRGGVPTPFDRVLATRYGHAAAALAAAGRWGVMTALDAGTIGPVPLAAVAGAPRTIPPDSPVLAAARATGASFGEA